MFCGFGTENHCSRGVSFFFFSSENNDVGLLLPSIHLLVVLVKSPFTHLLENIDFSVARTLFSKK